MQENWIEWEDDYDADITTPKGHPADEGPFHVWWDDMRAREVRALVKRAYESGYRRGVNAHDDPRKIAREDSEDSLRSQCLQLAGWIFGLPPFSMITMDTDVAEEIAAEIEKLVEDWSNDLDQQIDKLARFIMAELDGEPSRNEGAIDTAIRLLRNWQACLQSSPIPGGLIKIKNKEDEQAG